MNISRTVSLLHFAILASMLGCGAEQSQRGGEGAEAMVPLDGGDAPPPDSSAAGDAGPADGFPVDDSAPPAGCWLAITGAYDAAGTSGEADVSAGYAGCGLESNGIHFSFWGTLPTPTAGICTTPYGSFQAWGSSTAGVANFGADPGPGYPLPGPGESCTWDIESTIDGPGVVGTPFVATFACVNLGASDGSSVAVSGGFRTTFGPPPK